VPLRAFLGRASAARRKLVAKGDQVVAVDLVVALDDRPGALGVVTGALGEAGINIEDLAMRHATDATGARCWSGSSVPPRNARWPRSVPAGSPPTSRGTDRDHRSPPDRPRHRAPDGASDVAVSVPGSKSLTNRALVAAALATGTSVLDGVLFADDTEAMLTALDALGIGVTIDRPGTRVTVEGCGGAVPPGPATVDVRLSGTTARFLAPLLGARARAGTCSTRQRPSAPARWARCSRRSHSSGSRSARSARPATCLSPSRRRDPRRQGRGGG
jgi:hypothetical protein